MAYSDAAPASKANVRWTKFKVDLWATDFNDVELGILRDTQRQAESRQFTKDMNVIGQVLENGERTHLIGWREGLWDENEGVQKRLVLKLFTDSMNWKGSLDQMMGRSLQLTHASGVPTPAFSVNLARHEQVIQLERCARKIPFFPQAFSFFILDDDGARIFRLRQKRFSIGADYVLYDQRNRKIAEIDRRLWNLGGAWKVKILSDAMDADLQSTLTLFCAMQRFNRKCRREIRKLYGQVEKADEPVKLDHQEEDLYMNPRRVR